jgi:hypothetical protein
VTFRDNVPPPPALSPTSELAPEIVDVQKLVRYFMRSTHMSESVIRMKLSDRGRAFIDETLPRLQRCGVFVEIRNLGSSDQRRFRLGVTLNEINSAVKAANGSFELFVDQFV